MRVLAPAHRAATAVVPIAATTNFVSRMMPAQLPLYATAIALTFCAGSNSAFAQDQDLMFVRAPIARGGPVCRSRVK
jgi:hypothetical protein